MPNCADGLLVSHAWYLAAIHDVEDASFVFDRRIGSLIEYAPHLAVALGERWLLFTSALSSSPGHAPARRRDSWRKEKSLLWHRLRR